MAASLGAVEPIIKGKSFEDICKATFPVSGLISREPVHAALQSAQELLSNDGIPLSNLKNSELEGFIKDAPTAEPGSFTLAEYQALLESLTKYAVLKARHNNGKRWGLGLSLSTAGAMALTAAVFTSASMMVVAVPAGAAVGAVAVAADGSRSRRRDRRTAKQGSSSSSSSSSRAPASALNKAAAPAAAAAAEVQEPVPAADVAVEATPAPVMVEDSTLDIAPAGAEEEAVMTASPAAAAPAPATATAQEPVKESPAAIAAPAAAAAAAAAAAVAVAPPAVPAPAAPTPAPVGSGNSSPRGSSEQLVGAVVDFTPAAAPAAADSKPASHPTVDIDSAAAAASADDDNTSLSDVPAPVQCDSPFSAAARDTGAAAYASELPADALLMPPAVRTSTGSDLLSNTSAAAAPSSGLPPKPKKSKSLTKSMSKKLKKAFSLKDKDVSSSNGFSADAGAHRALDADSADGSPLAPPVPPRKSGSFFRRSSDGSSGSFLRRSTDGSGSFFRRSSSDMGADGDSVDGSVERSKGSATIKKMVDGIRRSFSLERPSLELLSSKKARKADKAAAAL